MRYNFREVIHPTFGRVSVLARASAWDGRAIEKNPSIRGPADLLPKFSWTILRDGSHRENGKRHRPPRKETYWSFIGGIPKVLDEFLTDKGRRQDSNCPTVQISENNVEIPTQSRQNFLLQSFVEKRKYLPSANFAKIKLISWKELFNSPYQEHFDWTSMANRSKSTHAQSDLCFYYVAINLFICLK